MTEPYADALRKAQEELAESEAAAEVLDRKRARLRQTVAVLQSLVGVEATQEMSLTEAVLMAVKAREGYITAYQVVKLLEEMGFKAKTASVATILSRLVKNGKITSHVAGYKWKTPITKPERNQALKDLIVKKIKEEDLTPKPRED